MNGRVVLVRAGLLSFAEKVGSLTHSYFKTVITDISLFTFFVFICLIQVANAGRLNASAVLIYPDPVNYSIRENTALFGHVSFGTVLLSEYLCIKKFM